MRTIRLVPALLRPTLRAVTWWPPLAAAAFAVALVELALTRDPAAAAMLNWLRAAAVGCALGAAVLLDDPAEPSTEAVAGSLLLRRTLRVALAAPVLAAGWAAATWRATAAVPAVGPMVPGLALEAAALLAVTLALATAGARYAPERLGGVVAAPGLLAAVALALALPDRAALFAGPGPGWPAAHHRWAAVLVLAVAGFVAASTDRARHRAGTGVRWSPVR